MKTTFYSNRRLLGVLMFVLLMTVIMVSSMEVSAYAAEFPSESQYVMEYSDDTTTLDALYGNHFGYSILKNAMQKNIYAACAYTVQNFYGELCLPAELKVQYGDVYNALKYFRYDFPNINHYAGFATTFSSGGVEKLTPNYVHPIDGVYCTMESLVQATHEYEAKVSEILASVPEGAVTEYDKALYLYNYLASNVEYINCDGADTAYGALVNGKAICSGYSFAYADLLSRLGIKTWTVLGMATTNSGSGYHAWNVSWLNGECVYSDITWDDNGTKADYEYFQIPLEQMSIDHEADNDYKEVFGSCCGHDGHIYREPVVDVTGITCSRASHKITSLGGSFELNWNVSPVNATNPCVTITTDNPSVVSVSQSGIITAIGEGTAMISVTTQDGNFVAQCKVVVELPHVHDIQEVAPIPATCTEAGRMAHYKCSSCDVLFADPQATDPITDLSYLTVPALDHSHGGWKANNMGHSRICAVCGISWLRTETHQDSDNNAACDVCEFTMPVGPNQEQSNITFDVSIAPVVHMISAIVLYCAVLTAIISAAMSNIM